ncbi:MAG: AAA family ATPase [Bacteroidota bacterium]
MIKSIQIKNFKSVVDLKLELGQFNVLIGENGCGKTNILEAIAFGAASNADKLDYEFLGNRGLRVTENDFMFSAFENGKKKKAIEIDFIDDQNKAYPVNLSYEGSPLSWINTNKEIAYKEIDKIFKEISSGNKESLSNLADTVKEKSWISAISDMFNEISTDKNSVTIFSSLYKSIIENLFNNPYIADFIIYNPEQTYLRDFRASTQKLPFSSKGEGLFQELKKISKNKKKSKQINEIKNLLEVIDWFEDFTIPGDLLSNEFTLKVKDKYLNKKLDYFDQRSTNEGFLFLLFYFTLFVSKETPPFFAIDNIEASFNPKLCTKVIQTLSKLSNKMKKQVITTTHNPAVLDGLDLKNDNQRLFVVSRNIEGHTKIRRIEYKADRNISLSEAWRKGYIGGLPDNF